MEGVLLNTRNAHRGNARELCGNAVAGEDLPGELPWDPSWAKEQQPTVMGSKLRLLSHRFLC